MPQANIEITVQMDKAAVMAYFNAANSLKTFANKMRCVLNKHRRIQHAEKVRARKLRNKHK